MNLLSKLNRDTVNAIIEYGIDRLENVQPGTDASELHHELYNMDYFIIGTYQAKQFLGDEAFDAIGAIQEYENDTFGEVTTDLSDPERVVNMLAYIVGEEALNECEHLGEMWDEPLEQSDIDKIKDQLQELI